MESIVPHMFLSVSKRHTSQGHYVMLIIIIIIRFEKDELDTLCCIHTLGLEEVYEKYETFGMTFRFLNFPAINSMGNGTGVVDEITPETNQPFPLGSRILPYVLLLYWFDFLQLRYGVPGVYCDKRWKRCK